MFRSFDPDDLGNQTSAAYGNGASQAFGFDPVSRLTSLTVDLSGTASDLTKTFAYNPASQIVTETRSNDAYAQVLANSTQTTVTNGLNQLATVNGTAATYDARGNMTTDPVTGKTNTYYASNNQLWTNPSPYTVFTYDALDRLASMSTGSPVTNYVSDGSNIIAEYDGSNALQKRYVFDGSGSPLVAYDAAGNRTWMLSDERGSVVALANDSAAMTAIDTYDEYGVPSATNQGTFQYAGMLWLSTPGLYAPTFRAYGAHLGRFNQTDPVGYARGANLYNYTGSDPVNLVDPLGLTDRGINIPPCTEKQGQSCVTGPSEPAQQELPASLSGGGRPNPTITVTGQRQNAKTTFSCADAMKERGKIVATGINVTAVLALGWTITRGRWRNLSTGTTGHFTTYGFAAGVEASAGVSNMEYDSLQALTGWSDGWSAGISIPAGVLPFAIGFSFQGASNDAGAGHGGFAGVAPKEGLPAAGASGNFTETNISQCKAGAH